MPWLWIIGYVGLIVVLSYLHALDQASGRWERTLLGLVFLVIPMLAGPVVLWFGHRVGGVGALYLVALALTAVPAALQIGPMLVPLASRRLDAAARSSVQRGKDRIRDDEAALRRVFVSPRTVKFADHGYVVLEGNYPIKLSLRGRTEETADRFREVLARDLVGRSVVVHLATDFSQRYTPNCRSGVTDRFRLGPGGRYSDIPAHLELDGRILVGWSGTELIWRERSGPAG